MIDYLLAGGTGLVGSEVIRQLLNSTETGTVICLGRRPIDSADKRLQNVSYDFTGQMKITAKPKSPVAICTLGTTIKQAGSQEAFRKVDFDFVLDFGHQAEDLGALSLHVVTAHGAAKDSMIFYNRVKGEIETALRALRIPAIHIYRPSLLIGNRAEHRAGEGFATAAAKVLSPLFRLPGLNAVKPTPADHLAAFILQTAKKTETGYFIHSNAEIMGV